MTRLTFVEVENNLQLLDYIDPPIFPALGDVVEAPDGRVYQIIQRAYLLSLPTKIISATRGAKEPTVEIRCMLQELKEVQECKTDKS